MLKKGNVTLAVLLAMVAILSTAAVLVPKLKLAEESSVLGSVTQGNEYFATTTRSFKGTQSVSTFSVLKNGPGTLGSVVILGAGAGSIYLYDATSTVTNTEWATTSLGVIPVSAAAGTYTFDVEFKKGLALEIVGTAPTSTITYR